MQVRGAIQIVFNFFDKFMGGCPVPNILGGKMKYFVFFFCKSTLPPLISDGLMVLFFNIIVETGDQTGCQSVLGVRGEGVKVKVHGHTRPNESKM